MVGEGKRARATRPAVLIAALLLASAAPLAGTADALTAHAPALAADRIPARLRAEARRAGLREAVLELALGAYRCGWREGHFRRPYLTVIDYTLPSLQRRLWVLDLERHRVLFHEFVAHGERSGDNYAVSFSNELGSRQSSLGLFRTAEIYDGQHGEALRLAGLERGVNDRAAERLLVMHGAPYVTTRFAWRTGRLGRSWGCPALPLGVHRRIIRTIEDGSAVFAYYPERDWMERSHFLDCR